MRQDMGTWPDSLSHIKLNGLAHLKKITIRVQSTVRGKEGIRVSLPPFWLVDMATGGMFTPFPTLESNAERWVNTLHMSYLWQQVGHSRLNLCWVERGGRMYLCETKHNFEARRGRATRAPWAQTSLTGICCPVGVPLWCPLCSTCRFLNKTNTRKTPCVGSSAKLPRARALRQAEM